MISSCPSFRISSGCCLHPFVVKKQGSPIGLKIRGSSANFLSQPLLKIHHRFSNFQSSNGNRSRRKRELNFCRISHTSWPSSFHVGPLFTTLCRRLILRLLLALLRRRWTIHSEDAIQYWRRSPFTHTHAATEINMSVKMCHTF